MSARTLVVGESLVDIVRRPGESALSEHVGGSPLNVAIGLARLGHPAELATHLAQDDHGRAIRAHLEADRVDLTPGSLNADHTSTATAVLDESGSATYEFDITWQPPEHLPAAFGHFHTGSIAAVLQPGAERVRDQMLTARRHATTSFDPNCRPTLIGEPAQVRAALEQMIGLADVVKASDEDIAWLYGADLDIARALSLWAPLGPALLVATRGADGAVVHVPGTGETTTVPGRTVTPVDTVGAGDSFQAGLLSGLWDAGLLGSIEARQRLSRASLQEVLPAVHRAIEASAITVSRAGAQPPTRDDLPR